MAQRFSQACENNKGVILAELIEHFAFSKRVLEIGSGTGQHAVYFAPALPHLIWQTSDLKVNHSSIQAWIDASSNTEALNNLKSPIEFMIGQHDWPDDKIDAVFSANTAHIMQPEETHKMMAMIAKNLPPKGIFCQYGPFKVDGQYTSESNQQFDLHLAREGCGGIPDISELESWAKGLSLVNRIPMPANNFMLVWQNTN
jgi:cyclopropane fatty-acyl-phospholipid synthase-like methyltransferase